MVKNVPANAETLEMRIQSLGWKDPLDYEMATHASILAWKNFMDRRAWRATVPAVTKSQTRLSYGAQREGVRRNTSLKEWHGCNCRSLEKRHIGTF